MTTPEQINAAQIIVNESLKKMICSRGNKFRSTYTIGNALEFKPYFDEAHNTQKDVCIPYVNYYTVTPQTLYKKIIDGLRWLMEQGSDDEEKKKYIIFRSRIKFVYSDKPDEGIWITYRAESIKPRGVATVVPSFDRASWKDALFRWLEEGATHVFDIDGLNLSIDDKIMVENLIERANEGRTPENKLVCKVTLTSIRVMP